MHPRNKSYTFERATCFEEHFIDNCQLLRPYLIFGSALTDGLSLWALKYVDFCTHLCSSEETLVINSRQLQLLARNGFVHACGVNWKRPCGRVALQKLTSSDVLSASLDHEFPFCLWLKAAKGRDFPRVMMSYLVDWRGICSVSQCLLGHI